MNRLEACVLDDSDAAFPFSRRLARDNGWTPTYTRRNWILPKPLWYRAANNFIAGLKGMIPKGRALDAALVTVLIAAAGCGTVVAGGVSPFDYQGPEFLEFFVVAWGVGIAMAAWLRWKLRLPAEEPPQGLHKLDPYTIAYLSGGKERTVNAAIVALFNAKILKKHHCELRLLRSDPPLPNAHAFEQAVYAHVPEEGTSALTEFRTSLAPLLKTFGIEGALRTTRGHDRIARAMKPITGYCLIKPEDLHWRPSNLMKIPNADFLERTGSENLGARLWRLPPKSANTLHKHIRAEKFYFVPEGTGRLRVGDETLTMPRRGSVLVGPDLINSNPPPPSSN